MKYRLDVSIPPQGEKAVLEVDPADTALIVIDMQNGFCHDEGGLAKAGINMQPQKSIIPNVKRLVQSCRAAGVPIIWTRQQHFPPERTRLIHKIPTHHDKRKYYPCLMGTWDAEIVDELKAEIKPSDYILDKHRMSCFYNTGLEVVLRMLGAKLLIISGVATYVCVETTVRDAYARDFDVVVVRECVAASSQPLHEDTLRKVDLFFGLVLPLNNIEAALAKPIPVAT